jgi:predicted nicotinamide N-methyase
MSPPLLPEIVLHLAEQSLPIWERTEEELGASNLPPPFWAFAWAGGQALARYLLDRPDLVRGRRVVDLGAGSGLVSIAASMAGARHVLATDIDPLACTAMALNMLANGVTVEVRDADLLNEAPVQMDLALIGDLFYERELARRVLAWAAAAHRQGTLVLAGDPRRTYFPADRFTRVASYDVPVSRELEDAEIKPTVVWTFGAAQNA